VQRRDLLRRKSLLGRPLFAVLPNEYSRLFRSYSECRPLSKGALAEAFDRLAGAGAPDPLSQIGSDPKQASMSPAGHQGVLPPNKTIILSNT
jgi:hypothetical protein